MEQTAEYSLHAVTERHELDAVVEVVWTAQHYPYMPSLAMQFPIFGYSADDRKRALAASKERVWNEYVRSRGESMGWICVKHRGQEIVAGAQWEHHQGSPFPNGCPKLSFHWWPEGETKEFCQEVLGQASTPRSMWMQRPHGGFNMMVVLPQHRERGIGGMIVRYTNRKLDEKGIEGFLEASELGRRCYERHGYVVAMKLDFFVPPNKPDEWQRLAHDLMPPPWYAMWRPVRGGPDPDGRTKPWQLGLPIRA